MFDKEKKARKRERAFYQKTQRKATRRELSSDISKKPQRKGMTPAWTYKAGAIAGSLGLGLGSIFGLQLIMMTMANLGKDEAEKTGLFHAYGIPGGVYLFILFVVTPILCAIFWYKLHAVWYNNNAPYSPDDLDEYEDDSYVRTMEHIAREFDAAPDAGLGFDGHVSSIVGHAMISNKGIKKIDMPIFDPSVPGQVKRDENGNVMTEHVSMFDEDFGRELYKFSNVLSGDQKWYNATDYAFNEKNSAKEIAKGGNKRKGAFGRKEYDTLADYINGEFYPIESDTQRPAGVYFYDSRPVNTILIAITRGGKGQTVIEPSFDLWTREKKKWNIFTTDPKGELLAKFYYPATVRGMEVVQFNLMHPHLTNVFNPLINAVQQFRRNDPPKGSSIIDSIVDTLFPDNGEIWNPAAGNMFRRAVYMIMDDMIEKEKYLRYVGFRDNIPQEITDAEINRVYSKLTLFNVYKLIGDLASRISKDETFINVNPDDPPVIEKDLLTLMFDAMAMLPKNDLRTKAITANNAIKQVASAPQTIAGIYATLLTGLSCYADDTAIALMSGGLADSFDITGVGFPRRFGIQFDQAFTKKFRITEQLCEWELFRDSNLTESYGGDAFMHVEKLAPSGWTWIYFAGLLDQDVSYVRLKISSGSTVIKVFNFRFTKGYKTFDDITYVIDPITGKKIVYGGTLEEWNVERQQVETSVFQNNVYDPTLDSYVLKNMPIIASNQVYYTERPKFIFAITPPHLQVYQRHVLIMIKQIIDEIYSMSYTTKSNRKPIIGTRFMLEEFGNIRSGENGIPNIDTITSIALGQDVQLTFVLQSFQQLRSLYSEDVENIIRANSANTIFLKSNDKELIDELVRMSGTTHEARRKSKSVGQKKGDLITTAESVINLSIENVETTALKSNDFLMLAGPSPGNAVTMISGEMPVLSKDATIIPMAAGLHKHLPQATCKKSGQTQNYSDSSMPSSKSADAVNYLDNLIDGDKMVRDKVAQAKIARKMQEGFLATAKKYGITIGVDNGELAELMMNFVYEAHDKEVGVMRQAVAKPVEYWQIAADMKKCVELIRRGRSDTEKKAAADTLREHLVRCVLDENLSDLTKVYRDKKEKNAIGYNPSAVAQFVGKLANRYPKPKVIETDEVDPAARAHEDPNYHEQKEEEKPFDVLNERHRSALTELMVNMVRHQVTPPNGVGLSKSGDEWEMRVNGKTIVIYSIQDEDDEDAYYCTMVRDYKLVSELVNGTPGLLDLVVQKITENDY